MNTAGSAGVKTGPGATGVPKGKGTRAAVPRLRTDGIGPETRRPAAAILEVLAGVRTPTEVAQQLAIALTRYDLMEGRALQGLVAACAPRPQGRVRTPASELAALRRECEQLRRQVARPQALLRVTERTVGLAVAAPSTKSARVSPKKKRRKPTARALQAAAMLQEPVAAATSTDNGMSP